MAAVRMPSERVIAALVLCTLAGGGVLQLGGAGRVGELVWAAGTIVVVLPLTWSVARSVSRGDIGVDAIALIAIATALALGEYLPAVIVALMLAGGNALEAAASQHARKELTLLVQRAPRVAQRLVGETLEEVPVDELAIGDVVVVRAGEVVPANGEVRSGEATIDESALSGEPLPVTIKVGGTVQSGTANAGDAFELTVSRLAKDSTYAAIVRLVSSAAQERAPFVRLADRYAAFFLPFTLLVAAGAWAVSGDPTRALAVLVVATPCPLILAAPIALIAGLSRAARLGVIVKGGTAIERLGRARTVLLDKTGTLTIGTPEIERIEALTDLGGNEILRLAASLDRLSAHSLAGALVLDAERQQLALSQPTDVSERPGHGIVGVVDGRAVAVGSTDWLTQQNYAGAQVAAAGHDGGDEAGRAKILVGVDGTLAGVIVMADHLRADATSLADDLRAAGIKHIALVTGDRSETADEIGRLAKVDRVYAHQTPEDKLQVVASLRADDDLRPVVMVGDGINDAPALALADVGIALGAQGATVSSETADVVITVDRIDRVVDAITIGRRSLAIAEQSVRVGMALSIGAMAVAAAGYLPPVAGALFQEVVDVAVILNALRALRD